MPFVVDASMALAWVFPDEANPRVQAAFDRLAADQVLVPELWWFEVRNSLVTNERRNRISADQTVTALRLYEGLAIQIDRNASSETILALARKHRLTFYDASYLALAKQENCPLATLDAELMNAAPKEGVALVTVN